MAAPGGSEKAKSTIIIKRIKKGHGGGHGAAWKIAYADFVTAMMAFFLLMWLLGSTTKGDLKGIADHFNTPLAVALSGGSGAGDATSIINGGGKDLTASIGQVKNGTNDSKKKNPYQLRKDLEKAERERMELLKTKVDQVIITNVKLNEFRNQIKVEVTPDGLRIQILDDQNRPMFDSGSSLVQPYMREILRQIGTVLNDVDSKISLSGHTDSAPYGAGDRGYSNWELSSDRANASRRELIAGGLEPGKIVRVVGLADSSPLLKEDPRAAVNRRISIIVLNRLAEDRLEKGAGEVDASSAQDIENAVQAGRLGATSEVEVAPATAATVATAAPAEVAVAASAGAPTAAAPAAAAAAAAPAAPGHDLTR